MQRNKHKEIENNNLTKEHSSLSSSSNSSPQRTKVISDMSMPLRVFPKKCKANEELQSFTSKLIELRMQCPYNDYNANVGMVISPTLESQHDESLSVKLVIETKLSPQPVSFTCNVNTSVEHIISHVICALVDDASKVNFNDPFNSVNNCIDVIFVNFCCCRLIWMTLCSKSMG